MLYTTFGQAPLSWAAEQGHEAIVEILCDAGKVCANAQDERGRTALSWTAWQGVTNVDIDVRDTVYS